MCNLNLDNLIIEKYIANEGPVLYLIDEYHFNIVSTLENIRIASYLINNNNISLVGVEGYNSGYIYHNSAYQLDDYLDGNTDEINRIGKFPLFVDNIINPNVIKVGVDCYGLCSEIEIEAFDEIYIPGGIPHRNHFYRSMHFVKTLFEEYRRRKLKGNLLLNCGSNHNTDIVNLLNENILYNIINSSVSIFRIRALTHPNRI